ncbi:MAG TPA: hypothetical protein V6D18_21870 [Thermosynechococcaceae cyanobacterium]
MLETPEIPDVWVLDNFSRLTQGTGRSLGCAIPRIDDVLVNV